MSCYLVVESNILDTEKLAQYSQQAAQTLKDYGGKFLIKGAVQALHGEQTFANKAVIAFASEQLAKDWYFSDAYQALTELRNQAMDSQFQLITSQ
ncbi:DUF1330 domain-containing protein [Catenovulum sp. SM1970]|uniref:DUF1330 domain-containing protein n=1 Tax=Marinifaba aquimaris TaxID=2741323 RepID=UPI0015732306|nr:DUF1330 domain-containing protein [Marinifaba aquimaris]NTS76188.1 DUF1330 domain-containing protein [Marinifaba aquimaris]